LTSNVLVTGGAGFIGSHLVDRLLDEGRQVIVLDDLTTGSERNLGERMRDPKLRFVRGSILDEPLVDKLVTESSLVFHLAAAVGVRKIVEDHGGGGAAGLQLRREPDHSHAPILAHRD
jgi:UDP-glucose 4-epimerase